ncbi:Glycosyl transferase family 2 [Rhodovulum sp. ES.010]|uniref:glycosyltransferase family 2 protein n=1 Tax=Rhodovulum sp. ES.010 TaxID=1882821 RepID=UPI00092A2CD0|nr:glycosyltransferase family 2 protein [Rhodovulum sp. ES.010]SIO40726.1 Glycosyl transferase family 2 [Rhodovulum sp. ES.010]
MHPPLPLDSPSFLRRSLRTQRRGDFLCFDAVAGPAGSGRRAWLVFASGTPAQAIGPAGTTTIRSMRSIGGGLVVCADTPETEGPMPIRLGAAETALDLRPAETGLFSGLNTLVALRNGEGAAQAADWLAYHVRRGMQAALILDRAPAGDAAFAEALERNAAGIAGLERLVLLDLDAPLGKPGLPPEAHPFNAAEAPGKDRMDLPAPDPWTAPLGEVQIYEWLRHAYLDEARAVADLDLHDLLAPVEGPSVFDRAQEAPSGALLLVARHVFPWRVRDPEAPRFHDHACVPFDTPRRGRRWCVAPAKAGPGTVWRMVRIAGAHLRQEDLAPVYRCMGLRHRGHPVSRLVPKSSLVEDPALLRLCATEFGQSPVRMPRVAPPRIDPAATRTAIVTTMKNEGPFILDWLAYHRAIGVDDILIYTNDCSDGTDRLLDLLQRKGHVQHRDNPYRAMGLKPQHAALRAAEDEPLIRAADWLICMDVDEYINIKTGDGTLRALYQAVAGANMISCTWRLFGNAHIHGFEDAPVPAQFTRCAAELTRKPHQAWGFKTLFRNVGFFKKLGVHRPKGLTPQLWEHVNWVNGSGRPLPRQMYRTAWRSTADTVGYDLVQLNHYAVRSAESFLVKRDRGRVNHVDRDQGLAYWFRMNHNAEEELSIQRMIPAMEAERTRLLADPEIAAAHAAAVTAHRARIAALRATPTYAAFYAELTGWRMERLSRMLRHFGAEVFLAGPECIPDAVLRSAHGPDFFFTVPHGATAH